MLSACHHHLSRQPCLPILGRFENYIFADGGSWHIDTKSMLILQIKLTERLLNLCKLNKSVPVTSPLH